MPPYDGSELTCSKTPEDRWNSMMPILPDGSVIPEGRPHLRQCGRVPGTSRAAKLNREGRPSFESPSPPVSFPFSALSFSSSPFRRFRRGHCAATAPQPVTLAVRLAFAGCGEGPAIRRAGLVCRTSTPAAGTQPRSRAPCSQRWSTIMSIPSRSTAKTNAPRSFPRAWSTPRIGTGPLSAFPALQESPRLAELRRHQLLCRSLGEWRAGGHDARCFYPRHLRRHCAGETGPECRSGRAGYARAASRSSARTHPAQRCRAKTAASPPSMAPRFFRPLAGTGSMPFAIATPASGKRFFSPLRGRWW